MENSKKGIDAVEVLNNILADEIKNNTTTTTGKGIGRRYNKGKLRYELISDIALEEIAKVYTNGAEKYTDRDDDGNIIYDGANNWRKGLYWMDCIASTKRHIEKFVKGVDIDNETNTLHLANACWNLMTIIDFYKTFPQGDDRPKKFLKIPKIGIDIDGVLADFTSSWCELYPDVHQSPTSWYMDRMMLKRFEQMKTDNTLNDFYLNIKPLVSAEELPFEPFCYITSRPVSKEITEQWLDKHDFPCRTVYSINIKESKVDAAKEAGVEIFIDDSYDNFVDLNNNGVFTYLYTQPWNVKYDVGHMRLNSLNELPLLNK